MKALTLTQPWAALVAIGAKRIETRSWGTRHRGPLAIHAAKGFGGLPRGRSLADVCLDEPFRSALVAAGIRLFVAGQDLPLGAVVATCTLVGCYRIEGAYEDIYRRTYAAEHERAFGDFTPGRYAWVLTDVIALPEPIPARGMQGLWEWDEVGR